MTRMSVVEPPPGSLTVRMPTGPSLRRARAGRPVSRSSAAASARIRNRWARSMSHYYTHDEYHGNQKAMRSNGRAMGLAGFGVSLLLVTPAPRAPLPAQHLPH